MRATLNATMKGSVGALFLAVGCATEPVGLGPDQWPLDGGLVDGAGGASSAASTANSSAANTSSASGTSNSASAATGSGGSSAAAATGSGGSTPVGDGYISGSRLRVRYYQGDDGSRSFIGWRDTQLNIDCTFQTAADGQARCLPVVAGSMGIYFLDSACTVDGLMMTKNCPPAAYAGQTTTTCSPYSQRIFTVGAKIGSQPIYAKSGIQCVLVYMPGTWENNFDMYGVGAEIPPSTYAHATAMVE